MARANAPSQTPSHPITFLAPRTVVIDSGPANRAKGQLNQYQFAQYLDSLIEIPPGGVAATYFVFLHSPDRNGNTSFLDNVLRNVGRGRFINRLTMLHSTNEWDSTQFPRIIEAALPRYSTSRAFRQRLRRQYSPLWQRVLFHLLDWALPATGFVVSEIVLSSVASSATAPSGDVLIRSIETFLTAPLWLHGISGAIALIMQLAGRYKEQLLSSFPWNRGLAPGFTLTEAERAFLQGGDRHDFAPVVDSIVNSFDRPTVIVVDRAGTLDEFSETVLLEALRESRAAQTSNRICLLHLSRTDSRLRAKIGLRHMDYAKPEERLIEARLLPVDVAARLDCARHIGKTEADARATELIADLVEVADPAAESITRRFREMAADSEGAARPGPAHALAVLASAGIDGPREFDELELRRLLTRRDTTYARWLAMYGMTPSPPGELKEDLRTLQNLDLPLVNQRLVKSVGQVWRVERTTRRTLLPILAAADSPIPAVHAFWAAYIGERLRPDQRDGIDTTIELTHHLMRLAFPDAAQVKDPEAAAEFARVLVIATSRAVPRLIAYAQFDLAYDVILQLLNEVLRKDHPWKQPGFLREVERLSDHVWRVAAIRGVSEDIIHFQKLLAAHGGKAGISGIAASIGIWDSYDRAIRFVAVDRHETLSFKISGGDESSRVRLENLRRYAVNAALLSRYAYVLECLEVYPQDASWPAELILEQIHDSVEAPTFDYIEQLTFLQCLRIRSALNLISETVTGLQALGTRLNNISQSVKEDDLLARALWYLVRAEARIVALSLFPWRYISAGAKHDVLRAIEVTFGIDRPQEIDGELIDRLLASTEDAIEEALFIHDLCRLSLGKACLSNARLRYAWIVQRLRGAREATKLVGSWETDTTIAKELKAKHLFVGSLLIRAKIETDVEACVSCLRAACEEALKSGIQAPLGAIADDFARMALLLHDEELYRVGGEIIGVVVRQDKPDSSNSLEYLRWCNRTLQRGQFLRLLNQPRECLQAIAECLTLSEEDLPEGPRAYAQELLGDALLQACWCYDALGERDLLLSSLDRALAMSNSARRSAFPHLLVLKARLQVDDGATKDQVVRETVLKLRRHIETGQYSKRTILQVLPGLLRLARNDGVTPSPRNEIIAISAKAVSFVSEWMGTRTNLDFLDEAIEFDELRTESMQRLHDEYFAREAMSKTKLAELSKELAQGASEPLLSYLLQRFRTRIGITQKDPTALAIGKQLDERGIESLDSNQVRHLLERCRDIQSLDGRIILPPELVMLLPFVGGIAARDEVETAVVSWAKEFRAAIWNGTVEILRLVATEGFVQPRLADAMTTYLRITERFSHARAR